MIALPAKSCFFPADTLSEHTKTLAVKFGSMSLLYSDFPPFLFSNFTSLINTPLSMGLSMSYIFNATTLAPCIASTSTPVL